jgi:hypothetical protein
MTAAVMYDLSIKHTGVHVLLPLLLLKYAACELVDTRLFD